MQIIEYFNYIKEVGKHVTFMINFVEQIGQSTNIHQYYIRVMILSLK